MAGNESVFLDLKLLRLFETLYATRNVTRTAERLVLSQPTVSIGLGKLRRRFRDPLFVRTPDGMRPTPQADALIGHTRDVMRSLERLAESELKFDPSTASRKFRICMSDSSHLALLPPLLSHIRRVAPSVQIEAARIDAGMPLLLQSGEADLALIGYMTGLGAGFYQQALFTQDWICLTWPNHPRIGKKLTLRTYKTEAHVGILGGTSQQLLDGALKKHRIKRRIVLTLPGFLGLAGVLAGTDLIATLPRQIGEILAKLGGLRVHECPFPIPEFVVKQHWHARYHHDAGNRWLRNICDQTFRQNLKPD